MSAAPSPRHSSAPDRPAGPEHPCVALGIDVGGTKVAAGLVDLQGTVLLRRSAPTAADSLAVLDLVLTLADSLLDSARSLHRPVAGTGLSLCELVTPDGQIASDDTIAWRGLPIQTLLAERTALAVVEADIRAHALAEARYGAGRGLATFLYVNVGTGISSCLVLNGQPYTGMHGNALVLATMPVTVFDEQERKVEFALEAFASGAGLTQRYRRHRADTTRVEEIVADAAQGDPHATQILCSGGEALGSALAWLVNVLDPAAVVVGGGVGLAAGLYWTQALATARAHIYADTSRQVPIVPAVTGRDAGIIGAAARIFQKSQHGC